jgi:hypothetical protein
MSFDGNIGLTMIVCHMTAFAAIEPMKEMNSSSFARAVYTILLRYGLPQLVTTDPYSKFKGKFKQALETLKMQHPLSARGNHNANLVERFNRYLSLGLRVFNNNDRETNCDRHAPFCWTQTRNCTIRAWIPSNPLKLELQIPKIAAVIDTKFLLWRHCVVYHVWWTSWVLVIVLNNGSALSDRHVCWYFDLPSL